MSRDGNSQKRLEYTRRGRRGKNRRSTIVVLDNGGRVRLKDGDKIPSNKEGTWSVPNDSVEKYFDMIEKGKEKK